MGTSLFDSLWNAPSTPATPVTPVTQKPVAVAAPKTGDSFDALWNATPAKPTPAPPSTSVSVPSMRQASDDTRVGALPLKPAAPQAAGTMASGPLGAAESTVQGLLGGFGDEIGGAGAAAYDKLVGNPGSFSDNYARYRDIARGLDQGFAQAHPVGHAVAEIAGAAIPSIVTAGSTSGSVVPSLMARVGRGALAGGATSALYGAGNAQGSVADRVTAAMNAVPAGAVLGGALPVVSGTAGWLGRTAKGIVGSGQSAADRAIGQFGQTLNSAKMTPADLAAAGTAQQAQGAPVVAGDLMGDMGRKLVQWTVGQPSGEGAVLTSALRDRNAGQYDRVLAGTKAAMGQGFSNMPQTIDALLDSRRANAAPAYAAAYAKGPVMTPTLQGALTDPGFARAIEKGRALASTNALTSGDAPIAKAIPVMQDNGPSADVVARIQRQFPDDPEMQQVLMSHLGASSGAPTVSAPPTPQGVPIEVLDYAKRYLDGGIRRGFDANSGFDHTTANATSGLLNKVLDEVDAQVPEYAAARQLYHSDSKMLDAVQLGQQSLTMPPDELGQAVQQLSPPEQDMFRAGAMSAFKQKAASVADRNDLSKQLLTNPAMRQRFQSIAPNQDAFDAMNALRDRETGMARTLDFAQGGSNTADKQAMQSAMNGGITPSDLAVAPISPHRALMRVMGRFGQGIQAKTNAATADQLAPLLGSTPGSETFGQLIARLDALKAQGVMSNTRQQAGSLLAGVLPGVEAVMRNSNGLRLVSGDGFLARGFDQSPTILGEGFDSPVHSVGSEQKTVVIVVTPFRGPHISEKQKKHREGAQDGEQNVPCNGRCEGSEQCSHNRKTPYGSHSRAEAPGFVTHGGPEKNISSRAAKT